MRRVIAIGVCSTLSIGLIHAMAEWEVGSDSPEAQTVLEMLVLLSEEAVFPEDYDERMTDRVVPGDFDPNRFFGILTHLAMEPGYSLGYVYYSDDAGGEPMLTGVQDGEERSWFTDSHELAVSSADGVAHVRVDGTEEGFFELTVLSIMGTHFYRFWHANYHDWIPVCGDYSLGSLLAGLRRRYDEEEWDWNSEYNLSAETAVPKVELTADTATVTLLAFTQFGGLYELTSEYQREFPHTLNKSDSLRLIPFHCGVTF